jgi:hypothetical protein
MRYAILIPAAMLLYAAFAMHTVLDAVVSSLHLLPQ